MIGLELNKFLLKHKIRTAFGAPEQISEMPILHQQQILMLDAKATKQAYPNTSGNKAEKLYEVVIMCALMYALVSLGLPDEIARFIAPTVAQHIINILKQLTESRLMF